MLEQHRTNQIDSAFNNGSLQSAPKPQLRIPRKALITSLISLISPEPFSPESQPDISYHVISGSHGTGKTSAIVKAAQDVGKGVIYVDLPDDPLSHIGTLSRTLGIDLTDEISVWSQLPSLLGIQTRSSTPNEGVSS
jgi:hypothetical protein